MPKTTSKLEKTCKIFCSAFRSSNYQEYILEPLENLELPSPSPSFEADTHYTASGEIPIFLDTGSELSELEFEEDGSFVLLNSPHSPISRSNSREPLLGTPSTIDLSPSISIQADPFSPQCTEYFGQPKFTRTLARADLPVSPYLASPSVSSDYRLASPTDSRFTSPLGSPPPSQWPQPGRHPRLPPPVYAQPTAPADPAPAGP